MSVSLYKRTLSSGSTSLYLDIRQGRKRWKESLNIIITKRDPKKKEKEELAKVIRSQREMQFLKGEHGGIPEHLKKVNFNDFAESFLRKYRKKDVRIVAGAIRKFQEFAKDSSLRVVDITPIMMQDYVKHLTYDAGLTGETSHNYYSRFKKVLKDAKMRGILKEMPTIDIRFENPSKNDTLKKQVLDADELQLLANTTCGNEEVKKAFLFSCFTSLGLAEIRELTWSNIIKGRLVTTRKKTGEAVNNRLSTTALELIGERKDKDEFLFDLGIISTNAVNKNIKLWSQRAGLDKKLTFYCGRHTFACLLLMNGANLKTVADAMGHRSTKSTLKYLNHVQRLQDEAIDRLPEILLKSEI
ncbi:MAG: site-specific integrase [Flavobacteriaceae bacterium]|nr:site-specific integrase [Flavobacteriaceae bacterium]